MLSFFIGLVRHVQSTQTSLHYLNSTSRENAKSSRFSPFLEGLVGVLTVCQLLGSLANVRSLIFLVGKFGLMMAMQHSPQHTQFYSPPDNCFWYQCSTWMKYSNVVYWIQWHVKLYFGDMCKDILSLIFSSLTEYSLKGNDICRLSKHVPLNVGL